MSDPDLRFFKSGMVLIESLIAMLIFSIGILALISMQVAAIKLSTDAQYRAEASLLANKLIGMMWVSDRTTSNLQRLYSKCDSADVCTAYTAWRNDIINSRKLPGVVIGTPTEPNVVVSADGTVTITLRWHSATDDPAKLPYHQYVAVAQIK